MLGWKPKFDDPRVASVRFRCLNPLAELQRRAFPIELFDQARFKQYSGVIFSKLYDQQNYELARKLKERGKAVIFDICDNHFYNPFHLEKFVTVREQLLKMLQVADVVVVSTPTLAEILVKEAELTSMPVVIGDAVEEDEPPQAEKRWWFRFPIKERIRSEGIANILWFGIHGGENAPYGMLDLLNQKDVLIDLNRTHPLQLVVVSDSCEKFKRYIEPLPVRTLYIEWGSIPFSKILRESDINIIPISRNPFTVCKTNNRLATALFAGVPTVADEIPSYRDLAPYCVLNDWERGLRLYIDHKPLGQEHARSARAYIMEHYTIKQVGDAWAKHLSAFVD
jgi:glycosyltransferase involved in cell wall biosynthesis